MLTHKNELTVPEVACYSREEVEGGTLVRYLIRQPGETAWRAVKVFRPTEPVANAQEGEQAWP